MASRGDQGNVPQSSSSEAVTDRIQRFFTQLTEGCGRRGCDNPDCATGASRPLSANHAAHRAMELVRSRTGRLCTMVETRTQPRTVIVGEERVVQELGVEGGRSEVTLLPPPVLTPPSTTEPMELVFTQSNVRDHSSRHLVIGASAASAFSRSRGSPSASVGSNSSALSTTTSSSSSSSSSSSTISGPLLASSSSSSSSSAVVQMASSNMVEEVARMEVSPTPHFSPSSSFSSLPVPSSKPSVPIVKSNQSADHLHLNVIRSTNEVDVMKMVEKAKSVTPSDWKEITEMIWMVFSDPNALNHSFLLPESQGVKVVTDETNHKRGTITLDVESVRRTYQVLLDLEVPAINNALQNAMTVYTSSLSRNQKFCQVEPLNHLVLLLENPQLHSPEFTSAAGKLLAAIGGLHVVQKEMLARYYATHPVERLREMVSNLQQLITMQLLFTEDDSKQRNRSLPQHDAIITSSTKVMMIFFFANLLVSKRSGVVRPASSKMSSITANPKPRFLDSIDCECDQLLMRLKVHPVNVLKPAIQWEEFRNEELNNRINILFDYQFFGESYMPTKPFSFLEYPFVLSTANKVERLLLDNRASHINERQRTFVHTLLTGVRDTPFLHLHISRDNIVSDTLSQLEAISEMNPVDLRKQMRVEFKGEEGLDEGGLQKELFQLLLENLLDPMYGLFIYDEMTRLHWFNPASFETEKQFRLIGLLFGLAIYNNIILDVHFPMVVYIKLLGCLTVFQDLFSSHPQIAQSLQSMLDYDGDDFRGTFMATFQVSFTDMFGNLQTFDLREGGDKIPVTLDNRQEYVDEYTNWLLNDSISSHFDAFKEGFDLVMGQTFLADLVLPDELEMMVCGSNDWNVDALEESTRYDGFTKTDRVIVNFWQVVREFGEMEKRQLLQFVTGSDRIPLGGMAKLKFIIVKNGHDSDRLPSAHTCFNALLLCDYSSKEKLRERLTKAISYAKGFGML